MMRLNKDAKSVISVLLVIILVIFSTASPDAVLKLLFLSFGTVWIVLSFCEDLMHDEKRQKLLSRTAGAVFAVLFIWSVISAGSLSAYERRLRTFFQTTPVDAADKASAEVYEEAGAGFRQIEEGILSADEQISQLAKDLQRYSETAEEQQFFADKYDPAEVEKIIGVIRKDLEEDAENESPSFSDIRTDAHTVEIYYKMRLGDQAFYYANLIRALGSVGIDCETMSIDEYELMTWDVERLFAEYDMRQSRLSDAVQGKSYEEAQRLYYRDHQINSNEYSDTTDYEDWRKQYGAPISGEDIVRRLDDDIMKYYKKLHMNFQTSSG